MTPTDLSPLWAVHISDGVLTAPWWIGGLILAGLLAGVGAWRIRDEEIPRIALLTAAFFVASQMHIPVPGGLTTVHLLLNGLLGVVLGRRALIAIPVGLLLQLVLFKHGGYYTLGTNSCVLGLPALGAGMIFGAMHRWRWIRHPWCRASLVFFSAFTFLLSLTYAVTLLLSNRPSQLVHADLTWANTITFHPAMLLGLALLSGVGALLERRLENAPEFPLGLLLGEMTVLVTILLHSLVLVGGRLADWHGLVLFSFLLHLPLAVVEGIILGFTVGFLARVKPELLGARTSTKPDGMVESVR